MRTLITGGRGALGLQVAALVPEALTPTSQELDVRDAGAVSEFVRAERVERVFHCAARTSVRECEEDKEQELHGHLLGVQVRPLRATSRPLIHPRDKPVGV